MSSRKQWTDKQGQYLAYIYTYYKLHGQAPAQIDMQRFFKVTPPTVHGMILTLEKKGLIRRIPRQPRAITLLVETSRIPKLQCVKTFGIDN